MSTDNKLRAIAFLGQYQAAGVNLQDGEVCPLQVTQDGKLITNASSAAVTNVNISEIAGSPVTISNALPVELSDGTNLFGNPSNPISENMAQWGGAAVGAASNISGDGSQVAPFYRPIPRRYASISTSTPLGAGASFVSAWVDTQATGGNWVVLQHRADVASGTVSIQGTNDTSVPNFTATLNTLGPGGSAVPNTTYTWGTYIPTRYWRVNYINGGSPQTTFNLTAFEATVPPNLVIGGNGSQPQISPNQGTLSISTTGAIVVAAGTNVSGATPDNIREDVQNSGGAARPMGSAQMLLQSAVGTPTWIEARTPSTFKTAIATAAGNTALWTPTAGKKFRLMRLVFQLTGNAAQAAAGILTIDLRDNVTSTNITFSAFVPSTGGTTFTDDHYTYLDLGNGILSAAANNVLNINLSAALTSGHVRIIAMGTEE
jgi:hypothetical protein